MAGGWRGGDSGVSLNYRLERNKEEREILGFRMIRLVCSESVQAVWPFDSRLHS